MSILFGVDGAAVGRRAVGRLILVSEFALAQGFAQGAGMLCGLIYVHSMAIEQYAAYALCVTALGLISVASDLGLNGSLNYFWRISLQNCTPFGSKLIAVRRLRAILFVGALVAGAVMLFTSEVMRAVTLPTLLVYFVIIALTSFLSVNIGIEIQTMRLEGHQRTSYWCETLGAGARLAAALSMILSGSGAAWLGLVGGLFGAIMSFVAVERFRSGMSRERHVVSPRDWRDIRAYLLPLAPSVVVFMLQDPLVYWFAATRTGPTAVAQVFALGRIGAIWAMLGMFTYVVVTPRLSRITDDRRFMQVTALCFVAMCMLAATALLAAWLAPNQLLLLIGPNYANLQTELPIGMATAAASMLTSFLILTARVRGWVKLDPVFALWQLAAITMLCGVWDFGSTRLILQLNLTIASSALLCAATVFILGLCRPDLVAARLT